MRKVYRVTLTADERALLRPMITYSDNDAATAVYARVGRDALLRIARAARMTRFDVAFNWADALLTAHDQARLFLRIDRQAPRRHRGYLRELLGSIVPSQRWGIAPAVDPSAVGSSTVGSSTVGSSTVGSSAIGSSTQARLQWARAVTGVRVDHHRGAARRTTVRRLPRAWATPRTA